MQKTQTKLAPDSRLLQGDILRDVHWVEHIVEVSGQIEVSRVVFPLAIVLTQDCDLEQDHRFRTEPKETQDKFLFSIILAPLYNFQHVLNGEHLSLIERNMVKIQDKNQRKNLKNNQLVRYHYLEFDDEIPVVASVIDFKHYFTATVNYLEHLRREKYVCSVAELFREDIVLRFANYLSRIGLPSPATPAED